MIPRQKVNYDFIDVLRSLFASDKASKSKLQKKLQKYFSSNYVLLTSSGRASLYYLLKRLPMKQVIVSSYTCKAVIEAALLAKKNLRFLDIEKEGYHFSPSALKKVLRPNTIVIATHQFGIPCAIEEMAKLCKEKKAFLIEDCAASLGSRVNGKLTGTFGDAAILSFDLTKLLHTPLKGGAIIVQDRHLYHDIEKHYLLTVKKQPFYLKIKNIFLGLIMLLLHYHFAYQFFYNIFLKKRYTTESPTLNIKLNEFYLYEMADWQANIILKQINIINKIVEKSQKIYIYYLDNLKGVKNFLLPPNDFSSEWACIRFPIRVKKNKIVFYREMVKQGIDCAFSFTHLPKKQQLNNSVRLADTILDIPFYFKLTEMEIGKVISTLKKIDKDFT